MTDTSTLAVHSGALGDLVLFGRLLEQLDGQVTLVAGGEKGKLLQELGVVARALDFDALPMHELFSDTPPSQCKLPQLLGRHDRLISCFGVDDPQARRRLIAFCGTGAADFLPIRPPPDWDSHLLDLWLQLLHAPGRGAIRGTGEAGPAGLIQFAPWPLCDSMRHEAQAALADIGCRDEYAVIHPGAGSKAKCWPMERFMELAEIVARRQPRQVPAHEHAPGATDRDGRATIAQVIFVVGPAEFDWWGQARLDSIRKRYPLLSAPPLGVLAGVLAGASLYIGNDSGVSHMAAAVGAPTIAIFGPSSSAHFAPLGPRVRIGSFTSSPPELGRWSAW